MFGIPLIGSLNNCAGRPFWSVMIPAYNSDRFLERAIGSVLLQAPEAHDMQIEVVDDCSTTVDVAELVRGVAGDRISVFRQPRRAGMCGNWNTCIERAKGHWIHILHQDDMVLPGFYQKLREGIEQNPGVGSAFCRHIIINEEGQWRHIPEMLNRRPGIIPDWLERIASEVLLQTPAVVVKREVYERIGGFRPEFVYTPDWEMWKRIAANYPVWYEPQPLACYRVHQSSETSSLVRTGADISDIRKCIELSRVYLPDSLADRVSKTAREKYALSAVRNARLMLMHRNPRAALAQILGALRCQISWRVVKAIIACASWALEGSLSHVFRKFLASCRQTGLKYRNKVKY